MIVFVLLGHSTRGAVACTQIPGSLEAANTAAHGGEKETVLVGLSVPSQAAPEDDETVEGQQH